MAKTSQKARMVYIEPNDLSSGKERLDNIVWNPEDLSMFVDLQVIIPDRNYDGSISYDSQVFSMSVRQKTDKKGYVSFMSGEPIKGQHYLTDDYLNASYSEITSTKVSARESLGITSLNIDFNEYFYPTINATFTDVRGMSLMMPAEMEYKEGLEGGSAYTNLFRALFKYPYPRFLLTIKGFLGTKVTFQLAVNEFKTTFNQKTGNFDINVSFIGYMYGLYTDLPMNLILIAPYLDADGYKPGNNWSQNENFVDSDGNRLLTFVEFMNSYVHVAEAISEDKNLVAAGSAISNYTNELKKVEDYKKLLSTLEALYEAVDAKFNGLSLKSDVNFLYFTPTTTEAKNIDINIYNNCSDVVRVIKEAYNEDYSNGLSIVTVNNGIPSVENFSDVIVKNGQIDTNSEAYNLIKEDDSIRNQLLNSPKNYEGLKTKIFKHDGILNKIRTRVDELMPNVYDKSIGATTEMKDIIASKLGFKPSIRNFMRMLFAHIDCFMNYMYNKTLTDIRKKQLDGSRVKVSGFLDAKCTIDVDRKLDNVEVPPFPGVFELNNNYREVTYPSMFPNMPEVDLVERITKAAVSFRNAINEIEKYAEQQGVLQGEQTMSDGYEMTFYPTCINDYYFNGVNPYLFLKYKGDSEEAIGELLYKFVCRYRASLYTYAINARTPVQMNTSAGGYTIETGGLERLQIAKDEAFNYYKIKPRISQQFKDFLSMGNDVSKLLPYLKNFTENHKTDLIANLDYMDDKIGIKNSDVDDIPIHFKTSLKSDVKNKDTQIYRKNFATSEEFQDVFKIFDKSEHSKILSFTKIEKLSSPESETKYDSVIPNVESVLSYKDYYDGNTDNGNRVYKITSTADVSVVDAVTKSTETIVKEAMNKGGIPTYDKYDKTKNGDGGEYWEMIQGMGINQNWDEYCMPYLNLPENDEQYFVFRSPFVLKQNEYAQALIFLALFPFSNKSSYGVIDKLLYQSSISCFPKHIFLYVCGLLYMNDYEKEQKSKFFVDTNGVKVPDYKISEGYSVRRNLNSILLGGDNFSIDKTGDYHILIKKLCSDTSEYQRYILKKYFSDWVDGEFKSLKEQLNANTNVYRLTKNNKLLRQYMNNYDAQRRLMQFYLDYVYVLNDANLKTPNMPIEELSKFVNHLAKLYDVTDGTDTPETKDTFSESDVSKEMKIGCYMTLKNLYDRWLASYRYENFHLSNPLTEYLHKQQKLSGNISSLPEWSGNEFDSFLYVDSYYNDIGDEYMFNPRIVYDMIKMSADADVNYSVYQFMSDLIQKNKMMLVALPLFNNYYDIDTIENIFRPYSLYSPDNHLLGGLGTTYLCIYNYETSHSANFGNIEDNCFDNDGVDLADTLGNFIPSNGDDIQLFSTKTGKLNITVPAFGVTFSKQNQSIFKSISLNSGDYRATDYGIKNTMELASNARKGFVNEPFGVGQDIFTIYSNRSYTCDVTMVGCMNIMPMMYFQLNNVPMFKGAYMITHVKHNITPGNIETSFRGVRVCRNQLPFNTDVFNLNAFISLVNEYKATGRAYTGYTISDGIEAINESTPAVTIGNYNAGPWAEVVKMMGAWYQANVHTYRGNRGKRKAYICDLINNNPVFDDCTAFVTACLIYFGAPVPKGNIKYPWTSKDFATKNQDNECYKTLIEAGFEQMDYNYTILKPFDIIATYYKNGNHHAEVYFGKNSRGTHCSYSWGSVHDGKNGHDVMPSKCDRSWIEGNVYQVIWRKK